MIYDGKTLILIDLSNTKGNKEGDNATPQLEKKKKKASCLFGSAAITLVTISCSCLSFPFISVNQKKGCLSLHPC